MPMFSRFAVIALSLMLLAGCDSGEKKKEAEANPCKGLDEAACTANAECFWKADATKCKQKKSEAAPGAGATPEGGGAEAPAPSPEPAPSPQPEAAPAPAPQPETTPAPGQQ
jgi:hypothetical protein